jgi:hypothetical protein
MKTYIGTKTIKAKPTTKKEYCDYRGWKVPEGEDPDEEIYLVEYEADPDSKPNHPDHEGYISMSPKHVFDKAYRPADTYLDRLKIERDDLADKLVKLDNALVTGSVPPSSVPTLELQASVMRKYLHILDTRLNG